MLNACSVVLNRTALIHDEAYSFPRCRRIVFKVTKFFFRGLVVVSIKNWGCNLHAHRGLYNPRTACTLQTYGSCMYAPCTDIYSRFRLLKLFPCIQNTNFRPATLPRLAENSRFRRPTILRLELGFRFFTFTVSIFFNCNL